MPGIFSVITRTPPGRRVRRTRAPPSCSRESSLPADPDGTSGRWVGTLVFVTGGLGRVLIRFFFDHVQRQLAALINFGNFDLEFLADRKYVIDVFNALATHELADLRNVEQPVFTRGQGNKRPR